MVGRVRSLHAAPQRHCQSFRGFVEELSGAKIATFAAGCWYRKPRACRTNTVAASVKKINTLIAIRRVAQLAERGFSGHLFS
jgi:hypothetical protein